MLCFSPLSARAICGQFGTSVTPPTPTPTPVAGRPGRHGKHYAKKRFERQAEHLQHQPNLRERVEELYQKLVSPVADQTAPQEVIEELRTALRAPKDEFFSLPHAADIDFAALSASTNAIATLLWALDRINKAKPPYDEDEDEFFFLMMN